jgi:hypothetical protein
MSNESPTFLQTIESKKLFEKLIDLKDYYFQYNTFLELLLATLKLL